MQAPKRWPESSHADWIAWRDHLDREAAAEPWLRLEADRELARIARCGSWQEKRPAPPLVPLVPERGGSMSTEPRSFALEAALAAHRGSGGSAPRSQPF